MKKILCVLALALLFAITVQAQITNISVPGDSSVVINYAYAGLLTQTNFSYDSLSNTCFLSLTTGFQATYKPAQWFSIITINGMKFDEKGKTATFARFWAKTQYSDYSLEFGLVGALSTESRPIMSTAAGQFESWTEASIPGGGLGVKAKYSLSKSSYLGLGVEQRNNMPEYHVRYSSKQWKLSLWYPEFTKKFGAALSFETDGFYDIAAFSNKQTVGNLMSLKISKQQDIDLYFDFGQNLATKKLVKLELGLLKNFSSPSLMLKGLIGLAYDHCNRAIVGYLFVHI